MKQQWRSLQRRVTATSGGKVKRRTGTITQVEEDLLPKVEITRQERAVESRKLTSRAVMDKLSPPSSMLLTGNLSENWKRFKQRFNIYLAASGAEGNNEKLKAHILLHVIGEDALDIQL